MKTLKDTVDLMVSPDYNDHLKAEYHQLRIRAERLKSMLDDWTFGRLDFTPKCPREVLNAQLAAMYSYKLLLEKRAEIEGVDLTSFYGAAG